MKKLIKKIAFRIEREHYIRGSTPKRITTLPHFLGLGPGQSGTTWFAQHLATHPDVYLTPKKETYYFSNRLNDLSLADYASLFRGGENQIRGEITPGYSILKRERIALIKRIIPDVRLFLTLRNPIERSWSAARRVMPKLGMSIDTISDAQLFNYLRHGWAYQPPNGLRLVGDYDSSLLEGHYGRTLDNWLSVFPSEQLLVIFFEDIQSRPSQVLARVCEHIGADAPFQWDEDIVRTAVNRNPVHELPDRVRHFLAALYRPEIEALAARLGGPAQTWLDALNDRS